MDYIEANRKAYDLLANEYDERTHEIKDEFWTNIYDDLEIKNKSIELMEIGPGNGRNIKIIRNYNPNIKITAVELSEKLCEIISKNNPQVKVINSNILDYEPEGKKYDVIIAIALIHLFPKNDAKNVLEKIYSMLNDNGYLLIGTTIDSEESEGFYTKLDYNIKVERFRHKYTKDGFENLLEESNFKIFKQYIIEEKDRNKIWNDIVVKKNI